MQRTRLLALTLMQLPICAAAVGESTSFEELAGTYQVGILPLLGRYCFDCHGIDCPDGELNLRRFNSLGEVRQETRVWQKVLHRLENGEMPPKDPLIDAN